MLEQVAIPLLAPTIELGTVRLRPLRLNDMSSILAYLREPIVTEHTSYPIQSLGSVRDAIERWQQGYAARTSCRWALARTSDDLVIGTCGFNQWAPAHASAELAYDLSPEYWGQGIMAAAVRAALDWAFTEVGFNRVQAVVMISNVRSSRLLERCGFCREGVLRSYRVARNEARDCLMYSLLKNEWSAALTEPPRGSETT